MMSTILACNVSPLKCWRRSFEGIVDKYSEPNSVVDQWGWMLSRKVSCLNVHDIGV